MDGFLLMARMQMDDMPLRLFKSEDDFKSYLLTATCTLAEEFTNATKLPGWSFSELLRIELVEFRNGLPVGVQHISGLEDMVAVD